jgi:hypothetical protein
MVWWIRCADVGPWAITREATASDVVVASEMTRLRTKERENQAMLPPDIITDAPANRCTKRPVSSKHDDRTSCPQLKIDL